MILVLLEKILQALPPVITSLAISRMCSLPSSDWQRTTTSSPFSALLLRQLFKGDNSRVPFENCPADFLRELANAAAIRVRNPLGNSSPSRPTLPLVPLAGNTFISCWMSSLDSFSVFKGGSLCLMPLADPLQEASRYSSLPEVVRITIDHFAL